MKIVLRAHLWKLNNDSEKLESQIRNIASRIAIKNKIPHHLVLIQLGFNGSDFAENKISIVFEVGEYITIKL